MPDAASLQRTSEVLAKVDKMCHERKGVSHTIGIGGYSLLLGTNNSNYASIFVILDDFDVRKHDPEQNGFAILFDLQAKLKREVQDGVVVVLPAPPVDGLGAAGGFKVMVQDRGGMGYGELEKFASDLAYKAQKSEGVSSASTQFRSAVPQLYADIDRTRCLQMGVSVSDVFDTLQAYLGGAYVNDFNLADRTWQVKVQADAKFRITAEYVKNLRVRNTKGEMVPLGSVATIQDSSGPGFVQRYNMYPAAAVNGSLAPGVSTGDGIRIIDTVAKDTLPKQMTYEWTELFYLQLLEGNSAIWAFIGAVVLVYLILAAMYESWSMPLAIVLVLPMCLLSAVAGVRAAGLDINIFVQVGFVVLVGLAAKNAILIVEFANQKRAGGEPLRESVLDASTARLRPIVMTSFAFILGVVPLVLATGAGAEMRATLGVAVFCGMLGVTFFGVLLTPVFAYVIGKYSPVKVQPSATPAANEHTPPNP
ncbi:MAG: efflux RND transporter permease subunit [Gemmataceae bacterium]